MPLEVYGQADDCWFMASGISESVFRTACPICLEVMKEESGKASYTVCVSCGALVHVACSETRHRCKACHSWD